MPSPRDTHCNFLGVFPDIFPMHVCVFKTKHKENNTSYRVEFVLWSL